MDANDGVTYLGHATVLLQIEGTRLLTDPFLRRRLGPLVRHGAPPRPSSWERLDAVLVSHLHRDHADLGSLRRLGREVRLIGPPGSRRFFERHGFAHVTELEPGRSVAVGSLSVTAVEAHHHGGRRLFAPHPTPVGFHLGGRRRVYFAGDTGYFDGMASLAPGLDLALLPVWGWGPTIGAGHLDPAAAARAASVLRPRLAVPIHWGTLYPLGLARLREAPLRRPGPEFAARVAALAPHVATRVLSPGESASLA
jgi:L-ascorbate metabolism protein UlaG (beta-lactamase superfamily)